MPLSSRAPLTPAQKRYYRQRAHANVFTDHELDYPASPDQMDWASHYPAYFPAKEGEAQKQVEWADVGCGFGGLIMALGPQFPDTLMLGELVVEPSEACGLEPGTGGC